MALGSIQASTSTETPGG